MMWVHITFVKINRERGLTTDRGTFLNDETVVAPLNQCGDNEPLRARIKRLGSVK